MPHLTRYPAINVILKACEKAAKGLKRDFGELENLQVSKKGIGDFVTTADTRTDSLLREELSKARPGYGFLSEELGTQGTAATGRWIIDPIDGTTNFIHGIPHFAISVALEEAGEITAGVIYEPLTDTAYWAAKGSGAFYNDRRLRVSGRSNLNDSLIATGIPFAGRNEAAADFMKNLNKIMPKVAGIRRMGAASLDMAYVAAGRYEAYWENRINFWDIAAGLIIVQEAGGIVTDLHSRSFSDGSRGILAANLVLQPHIYDLIQQSMALETDTVYA